MLPKGPPVDRHCRFCQHSHHMGGAFWIAPMHDMDFVARLREGLDDYKHLGTRSRIDGMLAMVRCWNQKNENKKFVKTFYEHFLHADVTNA